MTFMPSVSRELYAETLAEVQEAMSARGLVFTEEMRVLVCAWIEADRAMGGDFTFTVPPPDPDPDDPSPAHLLYRSTRNTPTGRLAAITKEPPMLDLNHDREKARRIPAEPTPSTPKVLYTGKGMTIAEGDVPPIPPGAVRGRGRTKGPSDLDLNNLGLAQHIKLEPGLVKLGSLKIRLSKLNKARNETEHPLIAWEQDSGHVIIRRL